MIGQAKSYAQVAEPHEELSNRVLNLLAWGRSKRMNLTNFSKGVRSGFVTILTYQVAWRSSSGWQGRRRQYCVVRWLRCWSSGGSRRRQIRRPGKPCQSNLNPVIKHRWRGATVSSLRREAGMVGMMEQGPGWLHHGSNDTSHDFRPEEIREPIPGY